MSTYTEALEVIPSELKSQAIQIFRHYQAFEKNKVIHPGPLYIINKWLKETRTSENPDPELIEVLEVVYGLCILLTLPEFQAQSNENLGRLLDALKTVPEMQKRYEIEEMKILLT